MSIHQILPTLPSAERFDEHAFAGRSNHPVEAHYVGCRNGINGWESNGISFDDYTRCQTSRRTRCQSGARRIKTPVWATSDSALQRVIVAYLETRAYGNGKKLRASCSYRSLRERLKRADAYLRASSKAQEERLDRLCCQYVNYRQAGGDQARLKKLAELISGLDTQIIINRDAPKVIATIAYSYYRQGRDSVAVAMDVGLHSPGVRQILHKLWNVAKEFGFSPEAAQNRKPTRAARGIRAPSPKTHLRDPAPLNVQTARVGVSRTPSAEP